MTLQASRLFICRNSFTISPLEGAIFWKLVFPIQSALTKINFSICQHFIYSFIHWINPYWAHTACQALSCPLADENKSLASGHEESLHSGVKICKQMDPLKLVQSVRCTTGSDWYEWALKSSLALALLPKSWALTQGCNSPQDYKTPLSNQSKRSMWVALHTNDFNTLSYKSAQQSQKGFKWTLFAPSLERYVGV